MTTGNEQWDLIADEKDVARIDGILKATSQPTLWGRYIEMQINTVSIENGEVVRHKVDVPYLMDIEFVLDDGRRVNVMGGTDLIVTTPSGTLVIIPEANNQITIQVRDHEHIVVERG